MKLKIFEEKKRRREEEKKREEEKQKNKIEEVLKRGGWTDNSIKKFNLEKGFIKVKKGFGSGINETFKLHSEIAKTTGLPVKFVFNDIEITIDEKSDIDKVKEEYLKSYYEKEKESPFVD
jgi:hypothetical protein